MKTNLKMNFKEWVLDLIYGFINVFKTLIILMLYVPLLFGAGASLYILLNEYPETGLVFFNSMLEVLGALNFIFKIILTIAGILFILLILRFYYEYEKKRKEKIREEAIEDYQRQLFWKDYDLKQKRKKDGRPNNK